MRFDVRLALLAALCALVAGCATTTAEMLASPGLPNGPTSGQDFGLVRYLADGSATDVAARQQDANHKMHDACGGRYRVLSKGSRSQLDLRPSGRFGRNVSASNKDYVYIKFVCTQV